MSRQPGRTIISASRFRRVVARHMRSRLPSGAEIIKIIPTNVGRFRFKHAVRFDITYQTRNGQTRQMIVHANIPSQDRKHESSVADRLERSLARHAASSPRITSPKSYGVIHSLNAHVYADIPGTPLRDLVQKDPRASLRAARGVGQWLSALARRRLRVGPQRRPEQFAEESRYFLENYRRVAPDAVERAAGILYTAVQAEKYVCRTFRHEFRTVHGDLDLGNVIVGPTSTAMIDFGNSVIFDPTSDAGNFLAQVDAAVWRGRIGTNLGRTIQTSFLQGAGSLKAGPAFRRRLLIHRAWWTLQVAAYACATEPAAGRRILPAALLRAQRLLLDARFSPVGALSDAKSRTFEKLLVDRTSAEAFFQRHYQDWFPEARQFTGFTIRHQPALSTTSFLTRYELELQTATKKIQRIVRGNFVSPETLDLVRHVHRRAHGFSTIRPLAYLPSAGYFFYEELSGKPLRNLPLRSADYGSVLKRVGGGLAALHNLPRGSLRQLTFDAEKRSLLSIAGNIKRFGGRCLPEVQTILRRLISSERRTWGQRKAIVHNDFQASNVLVRPRDVGIIDFTMSGVGHPAIDVANFSAHLEVMLHKDRSQAEIDRLRKGFMAGYASRNRAAKKRSFWRAVQIFELRSYLDILSITVLNLGPRDRNRRLYVQLLTNRIRQHITNLT